MLKGVGSGHVFTEIRMLTVWGGYAPPVIESKSRRGLAGMMVVKPYPLMVIMWSAVGISSDEHCCWLAGSG